MKLVGTYLQATRPAFLLAVVWPVLIGTASAHHDGVAITSLLFAITLLGALLIHAAANVLNDYYDARNGTDAHNRHYLHPYSGGSRFIQNGLLTTGQTLCYGLVLLILGIACGLFLIWQVGMGLFWLGLAGVLIAWGYSGPPLDLNRHGLGELAIAISFGLLVVAGSDYVHRQAWAWQPWLLALPYGLLASALLYINQFPDRHADARAGKRHWVVRLGVRRARWAYLLLVLGAHGYLAAMLLFGLFPASYGLALLAAPLSLLAAAQLLRHAHRPARLRRAIQLTIAALSVHGLLLCIGIMVTT